jgi:hypothetical protein
MKKNLPNPGVKGKHPLGCLPLWGREGVTLVIGHRKFVNNGKLEVQQTTFF